MLAALRNGRNTIGDITEAIYVDVSAALKRVAEFSVQAHLEKLVRDGKVKHEGGRYLLLSDNSHPLRSPNLAKLRRRLFPGDRSAGR